MGVDLKELKDTIVSYIKHNKEFCNSVNVFSFSYTIQDSTVYLEKNNNELKLKLTSGKLESESKTVCHSDDKFDIKKGFDILWNRLWNKLYATEENFKPHLEFVDKEIFGETLTQPDNNFGQPTDLIEVNGKRLNIGDVVEVYWLDSQFSYEEAKRYPTTSYVVSIDGVPFIAGYKKTSYSHNHKGAIYNDKFTRIEYLYKLVKPYEKLKNGEVHGNIKAVLSDTTQKKVEVKEEPKLEVEYNKPLLSKETLLQLIDNYRKLAVKLNDGTKEGKEYSEYYINLANSIENEVKKRD